MGRQQGITMLELGRCPAGHEIVGEASVIRRSGRLRCRECERRRELRRFLGLPTTPRPTQLELGRCARAGHPWMGPDDFTEYVYGGTPDDPPVRRVVVCHRCQHEARSDRAAPTRDESSAQR